MSIKKFALAVLCFTVISLAIMFGIAFAMGKFMVPPSSLNAFVTKYLGAYGPLIIYITLSTLGSGFAFLVTKKLFRPKMVKKEA